MQWYPASLFPIDLDLRPFLFYLQQQGVNCLVNEAPDGQQLMVRDQSLCPEVAHRAQQWLAGELAIEPAPESTNTLLPASTRLLSAVRLILAVPVTVFMLVLAGLCTLLVFLDEARLQWVAVLLFQPLEYGYLLPFEEGLRKGQYWRLLSPVFVHFGALHFVFNAVLVWVLGTRIELAKGSLHLLWAFALIGILSNLAQFLSEANTVFGGLSGVAYGFVGYVALYQRKVVHPVLNFPPPVLAILVVWMFLGFFGVMDFFVQGRVANAAHLGGLLSGAAIGLLAAQYDQRGAPENR